MTLSLCFATNEREKTEKGGLPLEEETVHIRHPLSRPGWRCTASCLVRRRSLLLFVFFLLILRGFEVKMIVVTRCRGCVACG